MNAFTNLWEVYHAQNADTSLNTTEIVRNLGGIDAILNICLNNEKYCQKHISIENLNHLQQLLLSDVNQTTKDTTVQHNMNTSTGDIEIIEAQDLTFAASSSTAVTAPTSRSMSTSYATKLHTHKDWIPIHSYSSKKIVYRVNGENNLHFKYLPRNIAKFMYYKASNKNCMLGFIILFVIFFILSSIVDYISSNDDVGDQTIGSTFWLTGWICICIGSIALLFSMNLDLASTIFNSFDFWFKMWNNIVAMMSLAQIR